MHGVNSVKNGICWFWNSQCFYTSFVIKYILSPHVGPHHISKLTFQSTPVSRQQILTIHLVMMDCVNILVPLTATEVQIQISWPPCSTQLPCDTYSTILLLLQCFKCLVYISTGKCERRFWWVQRPGTNKGTFQPTQATTDTSRGTSGCWRNAPVCTTRRWERIPVGITCKCFPRTIPYSGHVVDNGRCHLFDWCPHFRQIWHLPHLKKMKVPSKAIHLKNASPWRWWHYDPAKCW